MSNFFYLIIIIEIEGNGLWKFFPSKNYKTFVENEERSYNIVLDIINETLKDEKAMQEGNSLFLTVLRTEGLDIRDKIVGVIGKFIGLYNEKEDLSSHAHRDKSIIYNQIEV